MDFTSPKIDKRSFQELLKQMRSRAPFYAPEWNALQDKDAGIGLVNIYLNMYEQVIRRLNLAPHKNFVAFLDMMGIQILPAQSAETYVTFTLVEGTPDNVLVPQGTELAGTAASGEEVIFQTQKNLLVSFAALQEVFSVNGGKDEIYRHTGDFAAGNPFTLLSGENLQEHSLYLAHEDLFNQSKPAEIVVDFFLSSPAGEGVKFVWEYWNGNFWVMLGEFPEPDEKRDQTLTSRKSIDGTLAFRKSGAMTLKKNHFGEIKPVIVQEEEKRWIRCRLTNTLSAVAPIKLPTVNTIQLSVKPIEKFSPDMAFNNDIPIDLAVLTVPLLGKDITIRMVKPDIAEKGITSYQRKVKFTEGLKADDLLGFDNKILDPLRRRVESDVSDSPIVITLTEELVDDSTYKITQQTISALRLLLLNFSIDIWLDLIQNTVGLPHGNCAISNEELIEPFLNGLAAIIKPLAQNKVINVANPDEADKVLNELTIFIRDQVKLAIGEELNKDELFINIALRVLSTINTRLLEIFAVPPSPLPTPDDQKALWNKLIDILNPRRNKLFVSWEVFSKELDKIAKELMPREPADIDARNNVMTLILEYVKYTDYQIKMLTALRRNERIVRTESLAGYDFYPGTKAYLKGGVLPEPVTLCVPDASGNCTDESPVQNFPPSKDGSKEAYSTLEFQKGVNNPYIEGHTISILPVIKPFGEQPGLFDTFYLASDEAFSKKDAKVTLDIEAEWNEWDPNTTPPYKPDPLLSWEYWDGEGWRSLKVSDTTDRFQKNGTVKFTCPEDIAKVDVNGEEKFWIRARIVDGDYGREFILVPGSGTNLIVDIIDGTFYYPVIKEILIDYQSAKEQPQLCFIANSLNPEDRTKECNDNDFTFDPFAILPEEYPGIYLGFNKPLTLGPLRILFELNEQILPEEEKVKVHWFYWNGSDWKRINVSDDTENLTAIGTLEWVGSRDFAKSKMFGKELFWLRGAVVEGSHPDPVEIKRILLNTAKAFQASVIRDEIAGSSDLTANQEFPLLKKPVISQEVWVKEPKVPIEEEKQAIIAEEGEDAILEVRDESGEVQETWVRWHEVEDFDDSKNTDRHYTMDRRQAIIHFGDGKKGLVPPEGADNIKATYQYGGGTIGNVPPRSINGLRNSIPFVDTVANFLQADGGSETETLDQSLERGSQRLKNRERAVTPEDFERLARNAARKIARAKCLPNTDAEGEFNPGHVTVIIVPQSQDAKPEPSHQLLEIVSGRLTEQAASVLVSPDHIHIRGPEYLEVVVEATIVPASLEVAATVDSDVKQALNRFIHPLTGGAGKSGWEFGKDICHSEVVALIESLPGVDFVEKLAFRVGGDLLEGDVPVDEYTLPYPGEHFINLRLPVENGSSAKSIKQTTCVEG